MSTLNLRSSTTLTRSIGAAMLVVFAVIAGVLSANALVASGAKTTKPHLVGPGLTVFSHRKHLARSASTQGAKVAPAGAVLAAVDGGSEVFVNHNAEGEVCMTTITQGSTAAVGGCAQPAAVEAEGLVGFGVGGKDPKITVLAPNGVTSVTVTDRDGSTHTLPVTNNVALGEAANASTVSFGTPSRGTHTTAIRQG